MKALRNFMSSTSTLKQQAWLGGVDRLRDGSCELLSIDPKGRNCMQTIWIMKGESSASNYEQAFHPVPVYCTDRVAFELQKIKPLIYKKSWTNMLCSIFS